MDLYKKILCIRLVNFKWNGMRIEKVEREY